MPILALLTDFGTADPYVGAMKGAILTVCPEATLVDLVHDLPAYDVLSAALCLDAARRTFPPATVFVAVVDPGVGSSRRGLAALAGGQVFVGPDNGLLTLVLQDDPGLRIHALENQALFRNPVSPVFHGRDVFGPVAAHLARGLALGEVGPAVADPVTLALPEPRRLADGSWEATVLLVDRFGNLTTCLPAETVAGRRVEVRAGEVVLPLVRTYAEVAPGMPCAVVGSSGRLEIGVREGSAAARLGLGRGATVRVLAT